MKSKIIYFKELMKSGLLFIFIFVLIVCISVAGYMIIEKWDFFDSFYMTIITIATVGFGEIHPLSYQGRIHTIIIIITGVGFYSTMLVYFSSLVLEGKLINLMRSQKIMNKIKNLNNHYIICGYGRIGREVCGTLKLKDDVSFVIIEKDQIKVDDAIKDGFTVFRGDATDDDILLEVGIDKASGIICALTDDALNVFITLSAKVLNPNINIIARADKVESVAKLKRAGAHMVVAPYVIGGRRMASAVTQPFVLDFLDTVLHDDNFDLKLEQVLVITGSSLINTSFELSNIRDKSGAIIIAIKKKGGNLITNPKPTDYIESGDILIALGNTKQIKQLINLAT